MPAVAMEGRFRFVVNIRENGFEPPHVHDWAGNEVVCRIELTALCHQDRQGRIDVAEHSAIRMT